MPTPGRPAAAAVPHRSGSQQAANGGSRIPIIIIGVAPLHSGGSGRHLLRNAGMSSANTTTRPGSSAGATKHVDRDALVDGRGQ